MMKTLVVTGGIGSGKSLVCRILKEDHDSPVYEADVRAKQLYVEIPSMLDGIEAALGTALRDCNGDFVPSLLSQVIFGNPVALKKVEDMLFPVMIDDFARWASEQESDVVAFESATLLEKSQFDGFGDIVLLVDAPVQVRKERAMKRDGVAGEKILARMQAQTLMNMLSEGAEDSRVDYVLKNDSSEDDLREKLNGFIGKYGLTKKL